MLSKHICLDMHSYIRYRRIGSKASTAMKLFWGCVFDQERRVILLTSALAPKRPMSSCSRSLTARSICRARSSSFSHMNEAPGSASTAASDLTQTSTAGMVETFPNEGFKTFITLPASVREENPLVGDASMPMLSPEMVTSPEMLIGVIGLENVGRSERTLRLMGVSPRTSAAGMLT